MVCGGALKRDAVVGENIADVASDVLAVACSQSNQSYAHDNRLLLYLGSHPLFAWFGSVFCVRADVWFIEL